ncbi:MAG: response regulator transcription factor [Bacteroidetes bacterium]|nr:response regulator transcription factor [Bacteroidota bacterium]
MPNTDIAKVVIADDHGLFREGVKTALAQKKDIKVVGEAENGMQLLNLLKHNKADVVLLDIQMPVMDGISALSSIRKLYPDLKVIVLSMHEGHSMVSALMQSGANGYLTKTADSESIYLAIKTCQEKNYYFNELTNVSMLEGLRSKKKAPEKIVPNDFDGADLMRKLAASQKKSNGYTSSKTQTKILLAVFSVLLIGASVMAAITILGSANQLPGSVTKKKQGGFTDPLKTQQSAPIASVGTLTQQSPDSLQTKISANVTVDEKNNLLPGIAKSNSEKHPTRKFRDTANTHPAISIQQVDSAGNKNNAGQEKPSPSPASELKAMSKKYLHSLLTASSNDYHKGFFGGVSDIEITVNNRSNFTIDEAVVEVQYLLSNSKLYKTETLTFQNIQPSSSKTLEAPKSSRGSAIDYKIVSVKSKDLDL